MGMPRPETKWSGIFGKIPDRDQDCWVWSSLDWVPIGLGLNFPSTMDKGVVYCNLPALGGDSTYSTISPSLHICAAPTSSQAHGTHAIPATRPDWSLTHIDQPTGQPAGPSSHLVHHCTLFTGFITIWACYHIRRGSGSQRKAPRRHPDRLPKLVVRPVRSPEENSDGCKAIWGKYHI